MYPHYIVCEALFFTLLLSLVALPPSLCYSMQPFGTTKIIKSIFFCPESRQAQEQSPNLQWKIFEFSWVYSKITKCEICSCFVETSILGITPFRGNSALLLLSPYVSVGGQKLSLNLPSEKSTMLHKIVL